MLGLRMRNSMKVLVLEHVSTYIELIEFAKNEEVGRTRGGPNKRIPEEGRIVAVSHLSLFNVP